MLPANELLNVRRRVNRARNGRVCVTCPASRHVHLIADGLARGNTHMLDDDLENCAGSLLSVLESLWKARTELARLRAKGPAYVEAKRRLHPGNTL